ncbi:MAG: hypothetical protein JW728_03825 [Candidatus Aureabacteria bacterium]|nr:hypothetical protein [Candidatus Auribacterota bacterium]
MLKPGEITSFLLECRYPATGLIPTEISTEGIANIHRGQSSTYAAAIAQQILLMSGRIEEAAKMADTMRSLEEKRNIPNTVDLVSGLSSDFYTTAGPNAFWGIGFLKEYHLTKERKWLDAAVKIADFLISLQSVDGGIRKDPNPVNAEYRVKSTEENMDCYAFFKMLFRVTGDHKYEKVGEKILQWLAQSGVYNRKDGFFSIGTFNNVVDPTYGLDVNTLAIIILGPDILNAAEGDAIFDGQDTAEKIVENFNKALVTVDYLHPDGAKIKGVTGFDFTDKLGRGGREEIITPEFSSQAALAYMVMAAYEMDNENSRKAGYYSGKAKDALENLSRIAARTKEAASLPYATLPRMRRFGFDNWFTPEAEANISSCWVAFPLAGYNPFELDGFKIRDSIERVAPWVVDFGKISAEVTMFPQHIVPEGPSEITLSAYGEAVRESDVPERPFIYYKILYEKSLMDYLLAKSRLESALMTSYSAWAGGLLDISEAGYDAVEISQDGKLIKRKSYEIPPDIRKILEEEYLYFDELTGSQWMKTIKYNMDIDYSKGTNYAFEVDGDYNIVRQFRTEQDVPMSNREDLKDKTVEFKSVRGLPEGHVIMRYFTAVELDENNRVVDAYESVDDLPAMIAKVPINEQTYMRFNDATGQERRKLLESGIIPFFDGALAKREEGNFYYAQVLALDTSRRLFSRTYSRDRGTDIVVGTRLLLADWEVDKRTKINSVKYEKGLVDGMAMTIKRPLIGEKPLKTEPLWIFLGKDAINEEIRNLQNIQAGLLEKIDEEADAQVRQSFIKEFDRLNTEMFWLDDKGYLHTISHGLKGAEKLLKEIEKAKIKADASPKEYFSVLGRDIGGRDYRDVYGLVWIGVRDKKSGNLLQVETYDIAGNLKFILAGNIHIDPLTKNVIAETRTDILYDEETNQMIGSHTYVIDMEGNWVTDISESIYKGRTPDKKNYVMEKRIFVKNIDGATVFRDGLPAYETEADYYNMEGELEAKISGDIIAVMGYEDGRELLRDVYVNPLIKIDLNNIENLSNVLKGRQWVYRFRSTGEKPTLREALEKNLIYIAPEERQKAADIILVLVNSQADGEVIDTMVLEEREVINNLQGVYGEEAVSFVVYYMPGDAMGRERLKIMGGRIEIPFEWMSGKPVASRSLSFNLSGQVLSIREILDPARADSVFTGADMENMAALGITSDTLLPGSVEINYRIVTDAAGNPIPTDTISHINVSYLMPEDILSRELAVIKYNVIGKHKGLDIKKHIRRVRNWLGQEMLIEEWDGENNRRKEKTIGKKKEAIIKEWYNEAKTEEETRKALIREIAGEALRAARVDKERWPRTFSELEDLVKNGTIKERNLCVDLARIKSSLENMKGAPAGVLPGLHIIEDDGSLGEIKYFAGMFEYSRDVFSHKGISVPYEKEIKPFSLPAGPPILGLKYFILNSKDFIYDVHTLNGQLIVRARPYIQIRLVNMFPVESGDEQVEYYDPFVPYPYLRPIKIEKNFEPGRQPTGENPGMITIAVFPDNSTVYLNDGWKAQTFMERRPLDIDHWIKSVNYYDEDEELKYKKEHIESKSIYTLKRVGWKTPLALTAGILLAIWLFGLREHLGMLKKRDKRL